MCGGSASRASALGIRRVASAAGVGRCLDGDRTGVRRQGSDADHRGTPGRGGTRESEHGRRCRGTRTGARHRLSERERSQGGSRDSVPLRPRAARGGTRCCRMSVPCLDAKPSPIATGRYPDRCQTVADRAQRRDVPLARDRLHGALPCGLLGRRARLAAARPSRRRVAPLRRTVADRDRLRAAGQPRRSAARHICCSSATRSASSSARGAEPRVDRRFSQGDVPATQLRAACRSAAAVAPADSVWQRSGKQPCASEPRSHPTDRSHPAAARVLSGRILRASMGAPPPDPRRTNRHAPGPALAAASTAGIRAADCRRRRRARCCSSSCSAISVRRSSWRACFSRCTPSRARESAWRSRAARCWQAASTSAIC